MTYKKFHEISNAIKTFDHLSLMEKIYKTFPNTELILENKFYWISCYTLNIDKDSKIEFYTQNTYINLIYTLKCPYYSYCNISISKRTIRIQLNSTIIHSRTKKSCTYAHYFNEDDKLSNEELYQLFIDIHYGLLNNMDNIHNIIEHKLKQIGTKITL